MPQLPGLHQDILTHLQSHGQTGHVALARALEVTVLRVQEALVDLLAEGRIRHTEGGYTLVRVTYDPLLVLHDHGSVILKHLIGRKDTASGTAKTLRLPRERVEATLEALREQGQLNASVVGNLLLYSAHH